MIVRNRMWWPCCLTLPWMHTTQNPTDHPTDSGDMWECSKLKWKQMARKYPLCFALSFLWGMLPEVFDPSSLLRKHVSELGWDNTGSTVFSSGYSVLSGYTVEERDRQLHFFFEPFLVMVSWDFWAPSGINLIHKEARGSWTVWCQTGGTMPPEKWEKLFDFH